MKPTCPAWSPDATKTVVIPPLGSELKALAEATRQQITQQLGAEREQMLFGGWDEGAIQIFWPGNREDHRRSAAVSVWQDRAAAAGRPAYGIGWHVAGGGGISTDGERALSAFPRAVATQFFVPWLQQPASRFRIRSHILETTMNKLLGAVLILECRCRAPGGCIRQRSRPRRSALRWRRRGGAPRMNWLNGTKR